MPLNFVSTYREWAEGRRFVFGSAKRHYAC